MIDCFDGMPVTWAIGTSPDAIWSIQCWIGQLPCYRWERNRLFIPIVAVITAGRDGYGECRMQGSGVPCQRKDVHRITLPARDFFGHLKNEMFYNRSWQGIGTKQFIPILNDYLIWYREKRIKLSLHGLSPIEYRRKLGLI